MFILAFVVVLIAVFAVNGWAIQAHEDYERGLRDSGLKTPPADFLEYRRRYGLAPWRWLVLAPRITAEQMALSSRVQVDPRLETLRQRFLRRRAVSLLTIVGAIALLFVASRVL
jgi:hypothetical protein